MTYLPVWERLSDALIRVVTATDLSDVQAQADICRVIADGAVRIRSKLKRHHTKPLTSSETLQGSAVQIPTDLPPSDLDWEESWPKKPWLVRRDRGFRVNEYWQLAWIEVFRADVTTALCGAGERQAATESPLTRSATASRTRPQLERAKLAIDDCYPQVPPQSELSNAMLCRRIGSWLKEHGMSGVSDDTILRAAGRRQR